MVGVEHGIVLIREFDENRDKERVEYVERSCEVGPSGKVSLFTNLLGDPICRVRHSPAYLMLVAEIGEHIVGIIRGCIKTVTCGEKTSRNLKILKPVPISSKVAYILGLRVTPSHRRLGIGLTLVQHMEDWFRHCGAEYSYMATENDNHASVRLFTEKCGYSKFRMPSILVNPVYAHEIAVSKKISVIRVSPWDAEYIYRRRFSTTEFFPGDIDAVLNNKLNLGTFVAVPRGYGPWRGAEEFVNNTPESWSIMSLWNSKDVFTLEVRGVSLLKRAVARATRALDRAFQFLMLPSVPELFKPFGLLFMYGLGGEGTRALQMAKALCANAHNVARERGCAVVVTEVASRDPLRAAIPHWKMLSCAEDLWCVKRLQEYSGGLIGDWTKSPPGISIFVDPREF